MQQLIYDVYSVSTKGKSKSQINKLLKSESRSFAYIASNHISFFSRTGVSFSDFLINKIAKDSFLYISGKDADNAYLLVYLNKEIVYSGRLAKESVKEKINLFKTSMLEGTQVYVRECDFDIGIDHANTIAAEDYTKQALKSRFVLKSVAQIIAARNAMRKVLVRVAILAIIATAGTMYYFHYEQQQAALRAAEANKQIVDTWKNYHQAMQFANPSDELAAAIKQLNHVREVALPADMISKFDYQSGSLEVDFVNNGQPIQRINAWAHSKKIQLSDLSSETFKVSAPVEVKSTDRSRHIMSLQDVSAWLQDYYVTFPKQGLEYTAEDGISADHYQTQKFSLEVDKLPLSILSARIKVLDKLPIKLTDISGELSTGQFSGTINFQAIGE